MTAGDMFVLVLIALVLPSTSLQGNPKLMLPSCHPVQEQSSECVTKEQLISQQTQEDSNITEQSFLSMLLLSLNIGICTESRTLTVWPTVLTKSVLKNIVTIGPH